MFRKIISNISYSPALIESLSRLAIVLKKETHLRLLGVIFLTIAFSVQLIMLVHPPAQSNAANQQDSVYGGFSTLDDFISPYDHNTHHLRDILTELGITRYDILHSKKTPADLSTLYRVSLSSDVTTATISSFSYATSGNATDPNRQTAFLAKSLSPASSRYSSIYAGTTQQSKWFGINPANGDILLETPPKTAKNHTACPLSLPSGEYTCKDFFKQEVYNQTQSQPATRVAAEEDDHLLYTFTISNPSSKQLSVPFHVDLYDALEYASVLDSGGGTYDNQRGTITWQKITLQPGESVQHTVVLKISHTLPATGTGLSNPQSYDCKISSILATTKITVPLKCPLQKQVEQIIYNLPLLSVTAVAIEFIVIIAIVFLYFRSRQLKEEVRLIRKDINSGSIG